MRYAEPPVNPPEAVLHACPDCDASGEVVHHEGPLGPLVAVVEWCSACDGRGERELSQDDDSGAPDHWKDRL